MTIYAYAYLTSSIYKLYLNVFVAKSISLSYELTERKTFYSTISLGYSQAVRKDNKQRFSLLEENGELLIRANQGHTVKVK